LPLLACPKLDFTFFCLDTKETKGQGYLKISCFQQDFSFRATGAVAFTLACATLACRLPGPAHEKSLENLRNF
jgi:hypothetical protein